MFKEIDGSLAERTFVIEGGSDIEDKRKEILFECVLQYFSYHYPVDYERAGLNAYKSNEDLFADVLGVSLSDDRPQARPVLQEDFKGMIVSAVLEILESSAFPEVTVWYGEFNQTAVTGDWIAALCRDLHRHLKKANLPRARISSKIDRPEGMDFRR